MTSTCPAPSEVPELLAGWRRFVCIGHVNPDPDCLGAMFAVARAMAVNGKHATAALPDGSLSARTGFLADLAEAATATREDFNDADGFVVVDTARPARVNLPFELTVDDLGGRPVLNIDHHVSNTRFGTVNWVVEDAASTCELIHTLLVRMDATIDAASASLLYAGMLTDTAGFTLASTSTAALRAAADCLERGADVGMLGERLMRALSASDFRLLSVLQNNTRVVADGLVAYSVADYDEIQDAGCGPSDIDDQVKIPRSLAGVKVAILFTEAEKGITRINFRGEQGISVLPLAERFGGGGHAQAAGARLTCSAAEAIQRVIPAAIAAVNGET